ncbi:hypothetical protein [Bacillus benzoevorans]|uniref:Uncharacterized protein n=1 Tax=Bacillus benzoevorans TaxID=1456 RepID=A0A7X0HWU1_9BACI|nr:hypothetical protein [Bacillus benzoevorans]MBB6447377.1 hypothetical protein [Bacillus benzoevorans]
MKDQELQDRLNDIIWRNVPYHEQKLLTRELAERFVKLRFYKEPGEAAESFVEEVKGEIRDVYYGISYIFLRIFGKKKAISFLQKKYQKSRF